MKRLRAILNALFCVAIVGLFGVVSTAQAYNETTGGGGGGTPGGATGSIQFNQGGALGGAATGSGVLGSFAFPVNSAGGLPTVVGSPTTGDCLKWGPGISDAGAACGTGGSGGSGAGLNFQDDILTVSATDTLAPLSQTASGPFAELIVNGVTYNCLGGSPPCAMSGTAVTWSFTNSGFHVSPGDLVHAVYTFPGIAPSVTLGPNVATALGNTINAANGIPILVSAPSNGDCVKWQTGGGLADYGAPCGGSISFPQTVANGNSGGIPYFSSNTTLAASAVLAANNLMVGGGPGLAPSTVTTGTGVLTAAAIAVNTQNGLPTLASATYTTGDCLKWGPGIADAGAACGAGSGPYVYVTCLNTSGDSGLIQTAINSLSSTGGTVFIKGTVAQPCDLTTGFNETFSNISVRGTGSGQTVLAVNFASGDVITVNSSTAASYIQFCNFSGFTMQPAAGVTRSGGWGIHKYATNRCTFNDIDIERMYQGFLASGQYNGSGNVDYNTFITNSFFNSNTVAGIQVGDTSSTYNKWFPQNVFVYNSDISYNGTGLLIYNCGGCVTFEAQGINNGTGESDVPGTSQNVSRFSTSDGWDSSTGGLAGLNIEPTGGSVGGIWNGLWASSATGSGNGILINASSGSASDIVFNGCGAVNNGAYGAYVAGSGTSYVSFNNCFMGANSSSSANTYSGLSINAPATHISVLGGFYSDSAYHFANGTTASRQNVGIAVGGSMNYVTIEGADTTGNRNTSTTCTATFGNAGSGITCGSSITNAQIGGNQ